MPSLSPYFGDGLPVVISELLPPKRTIVLGGRDRPEAGVSVAGRQRAVKTHYPGSGVASVQVLGTEDEPITLTGWFQDPLTLIDGGAASRIAMLRGLMQSQAQCSINWGTALFRFGRVSRLNFEFHRALKVRYEIEFDVDQALEPVAKTPLPIVASTVADFAAAARAAAVAASYAVAAVSAVKTIGGVAP